jgi:murein DD-endopeptidase MepM/ murein hydrolase activator NlpD
MDGGGELPAAMRENIGIEFPLTQPTLGFVTRKIDPEAGHFGMDIAGKIGAPVVAAADGIVVFADWSYEYGFMMILSHADGYTTVYKHAQSLLKTVGSSVKRGEMIALLGNTGSTSSGPHLHFELWRDGVPMDPEQYLLNYQ